MPARVFLLSPASCSGRRAELLLGSSRMTLAERLRSPAGVPIGEVFSFISQLYFRGKLAYAHAFARPPALAPTEVEGLRRGRPALAPTEVEGLRRGRPAAVRATVDSGCASVPGGDVSAPAALGSGVFVITTSRGLVLPHAPVTVETLREFASIDLRPANDAYTRPLEAGARLVADQLGPEGEVVLLGSIASDKYVEVLMRVFGARLLFPRDFVGRGDMSRGGLMLRCVREGRELEYVPLSGAVRHGARPPKLIRVPGSRN